MVKLLSKAVLVCAMTAVIAQLFSAYFTHLRLLQNHVMDNSTANELLHLSTAADVQVSEQHTNAPHHKKSQAHVHTASDISSYILL